MGFVERVRKKVKTIFKAVKKSNQVFFQYLKTDTGPFLKRPKRISTLDLFEVSKKNSYAIYDQLDNSFALNKHNNTDPQALLESYSELKASYHDLEDEGSVDNMLNTFEKRAKDKFSDSFLDNPRLFIMASNYLLFQSVHKKDEKVDKDSFEYRVVEMASPENYDLVCLITACELSMKLSMSNVPNSLCVLVSDLPNASNTQYVKQVRQRYKSNGLPHTYLKIIDHYFNDIKIITRQDLGLGISQQERDLLGKKDSEEYKQWARGVAQNLEDFKNGKAILWGLESEYRKKAAKNIKNIQKQGIPKTKPAWTATSADNRLYLLHEQNPKYFVNIPIAVLTAKSKQPQCSMYTTEIFREVCSFGFNGFLGIYDYHESQTVNKAVHVAKNYYDISIDSMIIGIDENKFEIISNSINGQNRLPFTRFQK